MKGENIMKHYQATARKIPLPLQVDVQSQGIHNLIDEPQNAGGNNTGMNPMELLIASLGASLQETADIIVKERLVKICNTYIHLSNKKDLRIRTSGSLSPFLMVAF